MEAEMLYEALSGTIIGAGLALLLNFSARPLRFERIIR
jgi:hypothetical protein